MAIALTGQTTARGNSATPTITLPATINAADYILLFVAIDEPGDSFAPPTGFTELDEDLAPAGFPVGAVARKIAAGTEGGTNVNFTVTGGASDYAICALVYSGVDQTTPEDGVTVLSQGDNGNTVTCPTITPTTSPTLAVWCLGRDYTDTAMTTPGGTTQRSYASGGTWFAEAKVCDEAITGTSATGTRTSTSTGFGNSVGFSIILRDAAARPTISTPPVTTYASGDYTDSGHTWGLTFTATDADTPGADALTYYVRTSATFGAGTQVATGTCTSGASKVITGLAYNASGLVAGPNTLYLHIYDGALNTVTASPLGVNVGAPVAVTVSMFSPSMVGAAWFSELAAAGAWFDREYFDAPALSVTASKAVAWNVRAAITSTKASAWNVRGAVAATAVASAWAVRTAVAATTKATAWAVRAAVAQSVASSWNVRAAVASSKAAAWHVRGAISQSAASAWKVRQAVAQSVASAWNVLGLVSVEQAVAVAWKVRQAVAQTGASAWNVRAAIAQSAASAWHVRAAVAATKAAAWNVRAFVAQSVATAWNVRGAVASAKASAWTVRQAVASAKPASWNVRAIVTQSASAAWNVRAAVASAKATAWAVRQSVASTAASAWNVRAIVSQSVVSAWNVLGAQATPHVVTVGGSYDLLVASVAGSYANPLELEGSYGTATDTAGSYAYPLPIAGDYEPAQTVAGSV